MQLMMEMPNRQTAFIFDQQRIKPCMAKGCPQRQKIEMQNNMHRMRRDHQMDQHRREIEQMFNRVHSDARERPNIDIAMMERMKPIIKRFEMQNTVDAIKMK